MARHLPITIDRSVKVTLAEQIRKGITTAIDKGRLVPGARLPSWRDLAAQLGVARGTVRTAYERLIDAQLISGILGAACDFPDGGAGPGVLSRQAHLADTGAHRSSGSPRDG